MVRFASASLLPYAPMPSRGGCVAEWNRHAHWRVNMKPLLPYPNACVTLPVLPHHCPTACNLLPRHASPLLPARQRLQPRYRRLHCLAATAYPLERIERDLAALHRTTPLRSYLAAPHRVVRALHTAPLRARGNNLSSPHYPSSTFSITPHCAIRCAHCGLL